MRRKNVVQRHIIVMNHCRVCRMNVFLVKHVVLIQVLDKVVSRVVVVGFGVIIRVAIVIMVNVA